MEIALENTKNNDMLLEDFLKSAPDLNQNDISSIMEQLRVNDEKANNNSNAIEKLFQDTLTNGKVKVVESVVPSCILPSRVSASLYDVRVNAKGPDDKVYMKNKWIRDNITRGMTFLEVNQKGKPKTFDLVIYANKKFFGGVGDEDDTQPENNDVWQEFCLQSPATASQVLCLTKINGEAGHLAGRFIDGEFYYITGSKNVHMIVRNECDIDNYNDQRYSFAKIVAAAVMRQINSLPKQKLDFLKEFLAKTKLTAVFELTQPGYQHIVNLSHLREPELVFLIFTPTVGECPNNSFTALTPHYGLSIVKQLGLKTTEFRAIQPKDLNDTIEEIRKGKGDEGCVLYFVTEDNRTIGLSKVKSVWYIMLRSLREKVTFLFGVGKKKKQLELTEKIKATKKRFKEIQRWLKFDNEYLQKWGAIGETFITWLDAELKKKAIVPESIRPRFPIIWSNFLLSTGTSDDFS